jgi:nucleotide-binding universal stress UspA family protein
MEGAFEMLKALVPVDGSANSDRAVRHLISLVRGREPMTLYLLNVQEPIDSLEVRRFKLASEIRRLQKERGAEQLRTARALLDRARVPYEAHVAIGDIAQTIVRFAKKRRCGKIIMGTRGMGAIRNLLLGSIATKVIHFAGVPVTLVK